MADRRSFFKLLLSAIGLGAVIRGEAAFAAQKVAIPLAKVPALAKVGGSVTVKLKGTTVLFIRDAKESIRAVNAVCTHKQCLVGYAPKKGHIACPCHGSDFTLSGEVLSGPATEPLQTYPAKLTQDKIIITLEE